MKESPASNRRVQTDLERTMLALSDDLKGEWSRRDRSVRGMILPYAALSCLRVMTGLDDQPNKFCVATRPLLSVIHIDKDPQHNRLKAGGIKHENERKNRSEET